MDTFYNLLIPAMWIAWGIYWKVASYNVKSAVRHESAASLASHIVPLVIAICLLACPEIEGNPLFAQIWPRTPVTYWIGVVLIAAGLTFTVWARHTLGRNWSGTVTIKTGHELVRSGPYRWVRHPIYTGILLGFVGTAVAMAEWRGLLAALLVLVAFVVKLRLEERWMTEYFGPTYENYRREVKGLVPFLW